VKPDNIRIRKDGCAVLIDFGNAKSYIGKDGAHINQLTHLFYTGTPIFAS
jgi:serine/threonine protein kinase